MRKTPMATQTFTPRLKLGKERQSRVSCPMPNPLVNESFNTFSYNATSTGQYKILLPDCRTQIVDYYVDEYAKYHADVKYEGEICYHEPKPHPHKAAPYHAPAPAPYHAPAPAPYHAPAPAYAPAPYHA